MGADDGFGQELNGAERDLMYENQVCGFAGVVLGGFGGAGSGDFS